MPEPSRRAEARTQPRVPLPAMYTLLRVRPIGEARYRWTGHIYDVSLSGMRFELDATLDPGAEVEVRVMLPGTGHCTFRASGRVVRLHDGEFGPCRMAMNFDRFQNPADRARLEAYLTGHQRAAA